MIPQKISRIRRYRIVMSLRRRVSTEEIPHLRHYLDHDTIIMRDKNMKEYQEFIYTLRFIFRHCHLFSVIYINYNYLNGFIYG